MGDKDHNYYRDGFHARTRDEERKCEAMEVNVLMSIEDVTEKVNAGRQAGDVGRGGLQGTAAALWPRSKKNPPTKPSYASDVVTLYQGALYHLYRYKKLHRRSPGVCSRTADRLLRRRSG